MKYLLHSGLANDYTAHERASLLELSATLHLALQNFGDALPQFQEALRLGLPDLPVFVTASLSTAMLLIGKGDLELALTTTDALLTRAPHSLDGHLVRHLLLRQLDRRDESDSTVPTLAAAAPGHYGVFQLLLESILS